MSILYSIAHSNTSNRFVHLESSIVTTLIPLNGCPYFFIHTFPSKQSKMRPEFLTVFWNRFKESNKVISRPYYGVIASLLGVSAAIRLVSVNQVNQDLDVEVKKLREFKDCVIGHHDDIEKGNVDREMGIRNLFKDLKKFSDKYQLEKLKERSEKRRARYFSDEFRLQREEPMQPPSSSTKSGPFTL